MNPNPIEKETFTLVTASHRLPVEVIHYIFGFYLRKTDRTSKGFLQLLTISESTYCNQFRNISWPSQY